MLRSMTIAAAEDDDVLTRGACLACSIQPETKTAVDVLISELATLYTKSPDFVTAACWADDLKGLAEGIESPLHYIDIPYVKDNEPFTPAQNVRDGSAGWNRTALVFSHEVQ
jgi:hypothetical protein